MYVQTIFIATFFIPLDVKSVCCNAGGGLETADEYSGLHIYTVGFCRVGKTAALN